MAFPANFDTFSGTTSQGTSLLTSPDHSLDHRTLGSAAAALEQKVGLGSGTPQANQLLVGAASSGSAQWGSVVNNLTLGTPTIGTPSVTGGTITNTNIFGATLGTPILQVWDGWITETGTWSNVGTGLAHSGTFSIASDVTGRYQAGMRMKFTSGGSLQYGIIENVGAFSGGSTIFTFYAGSAYPLGTGVITTPFYSPNKVPFGFNPQPSFWTESGSVTTQGTAAPGQGTWTNIQGTLVVPIGNWRLMYDVVARINIANTASVYATLGTSGTAESDNDFTSYFTSAPNTSNFGGVLMHKEKMVSQAAIGTYFVNTKTDQSGGTLYNNGDLVATRVQAINAYL